MESINLGFKGVEYLISGISFLGLVIIAWPRPQAMWHAPASIVGRATWLGGMAVRFVAHNPQRRRPLTRAGLPE
jgi:hypothetical protein